MRPYFLILFISLLTTAKAICGDQDTLPKPLIPNKIADKYIPAQYQDIGGLLGYRLGVNLEKRLLKIDSAILLSGFRHRPGSQTWIGEHVGKFLFSASKTYSYMHDARIKHLMDDMVQKYIVCQMPDGYLGTYLEKDRWTDWDVWAHKYAIIGLLNYYSVTGYRPALTTATKAADLVCNTFGEGKRDLMLAGDHVGLAPGSILEPMIDLYRYTGKQKYLDFARYILRAYEQPTGPKLISQLEKYNDVTKVGDAKAYEMVSCFLGILKYYKLTGENKYLTLMQNAWKDISQNRLYITGTASDHEVFKQTGVFKAENEDNMGEGCVTVTWIQFNLQLLQITGDVKYAAELERSVYNHLFAAENPQTGCVSYYTALQGGKPYRCDQGFSCCLSSIPRGISLIPEMMGGNISNAFTILFYENGIANISLKANDGTNVDLKITERTKFPLNGEVNFRIVPSAEKEFSMNFRVPEWSTNFVVKVGGDSYTNTTSGIIGISRKWKKDDLVIVTFDTPLQILSGGISYPNQVAFKKGPQILAIDQGLNNKISNLNEVIYTHSTELAVNNDTLPADWDWKQAYQLPVKINNVPQNVILVPFSEAGQKGNNIEVWVHQ